MKDGQRSWAPKVLMCQAILGVHGSLSYWDISKQSFDSFIQLYDKETSWHFHILFTFFSFVPKSGKRMSVAQYIAGMKAWHMRTFGAQLRTYSIDGSSLTLPWPCNFEFTSIDSHRLTRKTCVWPHCRYTDRLFVQNALKCTGGIKPLNPFVLTRI